MSAKTRYGADDHARSISDETRGARGAIRRMAIKVTKRVYWQLTGHRIGRTVEAPEAEVFSGVGFYARPRPSSRAEAVLVRIGEAQHAVIIATRDEDLRKLWKDELDGAPDLAAMFNAATIVLIKPDNTVEIRSRGGVAVSLAKKADLDALKAAIVAWVPVAGDGGGALKAKLLELFDDPWPVGTTVLKGE